MNSGIFESERVARAVGSGRFAVKFYPVRHSNALSLEYAIVRGRYFTGEQIRRECAISGCDAMNGRLLMLMLATGLFMAGWSSGNPPTAVAHRSHVVGWAVPTNACSQNTESVPGQELPRIDDDKSMTTTQRDVTRSESRTLGSANSVWTAANCPAPLPAGISPGLYRVVSSTGCLGTLELTVNDDCCQGNTAAGTLTVPSRTESETEDELFITVAGSCRWYFIRMVGEEVARASARAGEPIEFRRLDVHPTVLAWLEVAADETLRWFKGHLQDLSMESSPSPASLELGTTDFQSIGESSSNPLDDTTSDATNLDLAPLPPEAG